MTGTSDALIQLSRGGAQVSVSRLAAALRSYSRNGVQLTESALDSPVPPMGAGLMLAPWPNRVEKGQWMLNGVRQQLDITEVPRGHAIHGLLRNQEYQVLASSTGSVLLSARIYPQHGYPFQVVHEVEFSLTELGSLAVKQTLINESDLPAPVALGSHPYLRLGEVPTENLTLRVPAAKYLSVDAGLIPRSHEAVRADNDLRDGVPVSHLDMDTAYTALEFNADGETRCTLTDSDGRWVSLHQSDTCQFVHIFVTAEFPDRNKAVAIEPMSAPANAFNTGDGLFWLESGARFSIDWGIDSQL